MAKKTKRARRTPPAKRQHQPTMPDKDLDKVVGGGWTVYFNYRTGQSTTTWDGPGQPPGPAPQIDGGSK